MSDKDWRDARLKKALDSAPDADARPAEAVREAILQKARLTADAAAKPAARQTSRPWRWLGSLSAVGALGALAVVLIGGRQLFLADQAVPEAAAPAPVIVAAEPAKSAVAAPPDIVVADARPAAKREAARRRSDESAKQVAAPRPSAVVAEATAPAPASPPPPAAAPARAAAPTPPDWTELRVATIDGPVTLRREQLSADAAGRLSRLLAAAESEQQMRTQLAEERQASGAAQAFARSPGVPGLLRIELLRGEQPVGSLALRPGDPLRTEIEAAAKPASAP